MEYQTLNTPKLRFPKFKDNWNIYQFGEIFTMINTNSYSRSMLNYESGSVKNIHYGDIHTKFNSNFDITKEKVPFLNEEIEVNKIAVGSYCKAGDLVIADASEDYKDVGRTIEIINTDNQKLVAGLHTYIARDVKNLTALGFKGYLMQTRNVRLQIMELATGVSVLSISKGNIVNLKLSIPSTDEQQKIASFLTSVDTKIQQHTKKKILLEQYKKGVMQKIFNQEIRFKDENGNDFPEWKNEKLKDIASKKSSNIAANKIEENFGDYIIYGASGVLKKVDFYKEEDDYISIVKDGAGVGRLLYCKGYSSVLGTMEILKPNKNINTYFLYCLLSNIDFVKYVTGSTIPHIYFKDYSHEVCPIPNIKEQTKIADFLSALDCKINNTNNLIEKTKLWKKGLLQQLFV